MNKHHTNKEYIPRKHQQEINISIIKIIQCFHSDTNIYMGFVYPSDNLYVSHPYAEGYALKYFIIC